MLSLHLGIVMLTQTLTLTHWPLWHARYGMRRRGSTACYIARQSTVAEQFSVSRLLFADSDRARFADHARFDSNVTSPPAIISDTYARISSCRKQQQVRLSIVLLYTPYLPFYHLSQMSQSTPQSPASPSNGMI